MQSSRFLRMGESDPWGPDPFNTGTQMFEIEDEPAVEDTSSTATKIPTPHLDTISEEVDFENEALPAKLVDPQWRKDHPLTIEIAERHIPEKSSPLKTHMYTCYYDDSADPSTSQDSPSVVLPPPGFTAADARSHFEQELAQVETKDEEEDKLIPTNEEDEQAAEADMTIDLEADVTVEAEADTTADTTMSDVSTEYARSQSPSPPPHDDPGIISSKLRMPVPAVLPPRRVTHTEAVTYLLYGPYGKHFAPLSTNQFLLPQTTPWPKFRFLYCLHEGETVKLAPYDHDARIMYLADFRYAQDYPTTIVEGFVNKWMVRAVSWWMGRSEFYWHKRNQNSRLRKREYSYLFLQRAVMNSAMRPWRREYNATRFPGQMLDITGRVIQNYEIGLPHEEDDVTEFGDVNEDQMGEQLDDDGIDDDDGDRDVTTDGGDWEEVDYFNPEISDFPGAEVGGISEIEDGELLERCSSRGTQRKGTSDEDEDHDNEMDDTLVDGMSFVLQGIAI